MEEILFRIIIVGDSSVGKSCLMLNFTEGGFKENYDLTVGVELGNRLFSADNRNIKFQIWDTSGQENYRSVTRSFYRRANCALLVFDISAQESFENCEYWVQEIKQNSKEEILIYLVANKADLIPSLTRFIDTVAITEFVNKHKLFGFMEVSAKTGENIEKVFGQIGAKLLEVEKVPNTKDSGKFEIQVISSNNKKKRCCKSN